MLIYRPDHLSISTTDILRCRLVILSASGFLYTLHLLFDPQQGGKRRAGEGGRIHRRRLKKKKVLSIHICEPLASYKNSMQHASHYIHTEEEGNPVLVHGEKSQTWNDFPARKRGHTHLHLGEMSKKNSDKAEIGGFNKPSACKVT